MADITVSTAVLQQMQSLLTNMNNAQLNIAKTLESMTSGTSAYAAGITKATDAQSVFTSAIDKTKSSIDSIKNYLSSSSIDSYADSLKKVSNIDFASFSNNLKQNLGLVTAVFTDAGTSLSNFSDDALTGAASTKQLNEDMGKLVQTLGSIPAVGPGVKLIADMVKSSEAVKQYENKLISLKGQFGGFADVESRLDFIQHLDKNLSNFTETQTELGNALSMSRKEVEQYSLKLMQIPGAYDSIVNVGGDVQKNLNLVEAAVRTARGTTGQYEDALHALDYQYQQFGKTNEDALTMLSKTYEISQQLGVKFDDLEKPIQNIAKEFTTLGNNTSATINLIGGLGKALKDTGLGIGPTMEIIQGVTGSISNLSIAQKAFLSQQAGGPGGLMGGFQIDLLMRQGKMDQVFEMMQSSLKQQFGGPIVGLEEAASSDVAAAQMQKQVAFLMEGPFGSIVKDQGQAFKLLEAFASGAAPEDTTVNALSNALTADNEIQNKQQDVMIGISNQIGELVQTSQMQLALEARKVVGGDTSKVSEFLQTLRDQSSNRAQAVGEKSFTNMGQTFSEEVDKTFDQITGVGQALVDDTKAKMEQNSINKLIESQTPNADRNVINTPTGPIPFRQTAGGPVSSFSDNTVKFAPLDVRVTLQDQNGTVISEQVQRTNLSQAVIGSKSSTSDKF